MVRPSLSHALLVLLVCTTTADLPAQGRGVSSVDSLRIDSIFASHARTDGPGCAVGVSTDGMLRFAKGYGMASLEHGIPIGARTTFNIGSIGKQFTAMATLLLEQRGALSLDDPVSKYYEGLPTDGPPIRVRDLLYHTSGLRDYGGLGMLAGAFPVTNRDFDALMRRQRGLNFPTGSKHEYSHSDYTVLASVIARAAGVPFAQFLETEIFAPLGMTSTRVLDDNRHPLPGIAYAYSGEPGALRTRYPTTEIVGGNNLFTSVEDLLRWDTNASTGQVGGKALMDRLHGPAPLTLPYVMPYAHGLWSEQYRGERVFSRGGGGGGYKTAYLRFPDAHLAVTVLCNDSEAKQMELAHRIADGFLVGRPAESDPTVDTIATPVGEAERLAGRYASVQTPWDPFEFVAHDGALFERYDEDSSRLVRLRDGRYTADGMIYAFTPGSSARSMRLLVTGDDIREEAERVPTTPPWQPSQSELAGYAGRWRSDELLVDWTTVIDRGTVKLQRPNAAEVALVPRDRDNFLGSVLNGAGYPTSIGVTFIRDRQGRVISFRVSAIPGPFEVAKGVTFTFIK